MGKKLFRKINGGLALYYGVGGLIISLGSGVGIFVWVYRIFTGEQNFSWLGFIVMLIIALISGIIGYSLVRVAKEEMD